MATEVIGISVNEYGVYVMTRVCPACNREFSITPAPRNSSLYRYCMDKDCSSYDPSLDIDHLFEDET